LNYARAPGPYRMACARRKRALRAVRF